MAPNWGRRCGQCGACCGVSVLVCIFAILVQILVSHAMFYRSMNCLLGLGEKPLKPADDPEGLLQKVHVVYSTDWRGMAGVLTSMSSLAKTLHRPEDCVVHLIVSKELYENATKVVQCLKWELLRYDSKPPEVQIHALRELPFEIAQLTRHHVVRLPEAWVRTLLPDYLPSAPRAIWLDHDVVLQSDIAALYRMHMEHAVAAVYDSTREGNRRVFNSGMLLFDLDRFRKEGLSQAIVHRVMNVTSNYADQDVLNDVFPEGEWDELDWRWNTQHMGILMLTEEDILVRIGTRLVHLPQLHSRVIQKFCLDQVHVLHFTSGPKYWFRPKSPPNCELVSRYALHAECLGWKFECQPEQQTQALAEPIHGLLPRWS